jgi:hypothetical protein
MACAINAGYTQDCRDSVGGVKEVYFISVDDIASYTESSGVLTAITKNTGKRFYKFAQKSNTASATETLTGSSENGTFYAAQEISLVFNKMQASMRNLLLLLAKNRLVAVVVDKNGTGWLYGRENGLDLNGGTAATGTAMGDKNGYTPTFSGQERELAPEVNAATIAALETPA